MSAEDAGTIVAQIRLELTQMQKDALEAQRKIGDLAAKMGKQGEQAGKVYVQGFGKAQAQLNTRLNNMVSSLTGVSPQLGAIGNKAAMLFSKPIFAMVPAVSMAFQAMLPVIGSILAAIAGIAAVVKKVMASTKEYNANIKLQADALKNVNESFKEEENAATSADMAKAALMETGKKAGKSYLTYLKIILPAFGAWSLIIKKVKENSDKLGQAVSWVADKLGIMTKEQQKANAEAQKLKGINEEIIKLKASYAKSDADIQKMQQLGGLYPDRYTRLSNVS